MRAGLEVSLQAIRTELRHHLVDALGEALDRCLQRTDLWPHHVKECETRFVEATGYDYIQIGGIIQGKIAGIEAEDVFFLHDPQRIGRPADAFRGAYQTPGNPGQPGDGAAATLAALHCWHTVR